jgi:hypothetical protein
MRPPVSPAASMLAWRRVALVIPLLALVTMACAIGTGSSGGTGPTPVPPTPTATATAVPPTATPTPSILAQGEPTLHGHCATGDFPGFDFDAGSASGTFDVLWGDTCISPGGADQVRSQPSGMLKLSLIATSGQTLAQFTAITLAQLQAKSYNSSEIGVLNGGIFAVHTHGGRFAKVLVEQIVTDFSSSDAVTYQFRFVTFA